MDMQGSQLIDAPVELTWHALNDPDMLKACITGCESIIQTGENQFDANLAVKIGPVSAKFKGKLSLEDVQAPNAYTLRFDGQGGAAGFGKGQASVTLAAVGAQTQLSYTVKATVGGKLAQIGSRLIDAAAKKMSDDFFAAFNSKVSAAAAQAEAQADVPPDVQAEPAQALAAPAAPSPTTPAAAQAPDPEPQQQPRPSVATPAPAPTPPATVQPSGLGLLRWLLLVALAGIVGYWLIR